MSAAVAMVEGMTELVMGGHGDQQDPLAEAKARGADAGAVLPRRPAGLEGPEGRATPAARPRSRPTRRPPASSSTSTRRTSSTSRPRNNRIRIPSRKLLQQTVTAAAEIGAKGVIVHGGHVAEGRRPRDRLRQLAQVHRPARAAGAAADREHRRRRERDGPAAGADRPAVGRDRRSRGRRHVGFCLDTCHAHAGGEELDGLVDKVTAITGRIDLVHANDSRDEFGSGADRHANFGDGEIAGEAIVAAVREAGAPVVWRPPAARGPGRRPRVAPRPAGLTPWPSSGGAAPDLDDPGPHAECAGDQCGQHGQRDRGIGEGPGEQRALGVHDVGQGVEAATACIQRRAGVQGQQHARQDQQREEQRLLHTPEHPFPVFRAAMASA